MYSLSIKLTRARPGFVTSFEIIFLDKYFSVTNTYVDYYTAIAEKSVINKASRVMGKQDTHHFAFMLQY